MDIRATSELHLEVRPAGMGDAAAIAALASELGYQRTAAEIAATLRSLATLEALAAGADGRGVIPAQTVLVACAQHEVVGWIEAAVVRHLQSDAFALIGGLVVAEDARGQGAGRLLCHAAEEWARAQGVTTMRVTSRSTRERAHRFYLGDGYERVKTSEVFEKKLR